MKRNSLDMVWVLFVLFSLCVIVWTLRILGWKGLIDGNYD